MKILQNKEKIQSYSLLVFDKHELYFSKLFFKLRKKISRLFSGHKWCKFHKKKSLKKFSVCPWNMRGSLLQSILEKHSSPTHLIQTSFFSSITVFSVKNVVLCDPFFPFRIQPSVALEAGKNILHSIRQQLLIRYVL